MSKVARFQTYRLGQETILVDMSYLGILPKTYETGPAHITTTKVQVHPAAGSKAYDPSVVIAPDLAWNAAPARRTWGGHTLLIGDSFTYRGLASLMPVFRHGRFLWTNNVGNSTIINAIPEADTVVIEMVQRYLGSSILVPSDFRRAGAQSIEEYDRARLAS